MARVSVLTVCLLVLGYSLGSFVRIDVTTLYQDEVIPNAFNVRCAPELHGNCAKSIISIQVIKDSDKTVANIKEGDYIAYNRLMRSSLKVKGHIDKEMKYTFLSVTVNHAVAEDSGVYTCKLVYLDEALRLQVEEASENVTVTNQDTQDIIRHLMAKVSSLENTVKSQQDVVSKVERAMKEQEKELTNELVDVRKTLTKQMTELEKCTNNVGSANLTAVEALARNVTEIQDTARVQTQRLDDVIEKDNTTVFFTAVHTLSDEFSSGGRLVYNFVLSNEGYGYDGRTGMFTAPVKGFYLFHISVAIVHNKSMWVDFKKDNGQILTRLLVGDDDYDDYSMTSCVALLEAGESVYPTIRRVDSDVFPRGIDTEDHMNEIYGYLLKAI